MKTSFNNLYNVAPDVFLPCNIGNYNIIMYNVIYIYHNFPRYFLNICKYNHDVY